MLTQRRPEAEAHGEQTARFAVAIGEELGLTPAALAELRLAALLHDVGELGVAGDPFNRPQMLSAEEHERIKEHPWHGARLLADLDQPDEVIDMVYQHHERWDGMGYPRGLPGEAIPMDGRITAVMDVYDALTHARVYRAAMSLERSLEIIRSGRGSHFDPAVLDAFLDCLEELPALDAVAGPGAL
jgi:putative nucleotidyltransferase with HDIG domain